MKLYAAPGARGVVRRLINRARIKFGLVNLNADQTAVVQGFIRCVQDHKLPERAAIIVVETGIVESDLQILANPNVPESMSIPHVGVGSDHASVGPLQQQVPWWGTAAQCMNPYTSAGSFLNRLVAFNWQAMSNGQAAQTVQVSAFPDRYQAQDSLATAIVTQFWTTTPIPSLEDDEMPYIFFDMTTPSHAALSDGGVVDHFTDGTTITNYRNVLKVVSVPVTPAFFNEKLGATKVALIDAALAQPRDASDTGPTIEEAILAPDIPVVQKT